jgi:NAD(P)-dependent dehydrogenase (short-subunit alcohol dehydrogenase family)
MKDKVVVITGGCRGIGRAMAETCAQRGYKVAALARTPADIETTSKALGPGHLALRCDVTDTAQLQESFHQIEKQLGPIYGLVCGAGVYGTIGPFSETPLAQWEKAIEINLLGTVRTVHTALQFMMQRSEGRILLFSGGGQGAMANFSSYVTSKGAIWRFNETLAAELAPHGIYVNAIAPGAVNTALLDELLKAGPDKVGPAIFAKSVEQKQKGGESPEKAAKLMLYLLAERSHGLYGKVISAIWDEYESWTDLEALSCTDKFTVRRQT